jgi:hypothetical protein
VLGGDPAVDHTDDDAVAVQALDAAQPVLTVEQAEKRRAVAERERAHLVFPDVQDFRHMPDHGRLFGRHARRKTIETVTVAVDPLDASAGLVDHASVLVRKLRNIGLDVRIFPVEANARRMANAAARTFGHCRLPLRCRRRAHLHDVDLAVDRIVSTLEANPYIAPVPHHRPRRRGRSCQDDQKATQQHELDDLHGVSR